MIRENPPQLQRPMADAVSVELAKYARALPIEGTLVSDCTPRQVAATLLLRRLVRGSLEAWCRHSLTPLGQAPAAHHLLLITELERIARGEIDRLMVLMPPGSAKSTYASVLFPAWFMAQAGNLNIIGASHTASLAEDFSRRVMGSVREHGATMGYRLTRETAELWQTTNGGRYRAAGVGGPITGSRADLVVIDDPVKSHLEAYSDRTRETIWNWYRADLITRLKPGARVVLIQTRWHEDDLAGRLLSDQPDRWRVLRLPALADDASDPLGRPLGAPLWPEWEDSAALADKRRTIGERDWMALFQQTPTPGEGGLFRVAGIPTIDAEPQGWRWVRAWDLAATEQVGTRDPDWTVGVRMGRSPDGAFAVGDVVRERGGTDVVEALITATASRDGRGTMISLPQDPGQAGKAQVLYLTRKLAGHRVESSPETGDKATRAAPFAAQTNVGNVSVVRGAWNRGYLDELAAFPSGAKDDQVDASSRAFNALVATPSPMRIAPINHMTR